MHPWEGSTFCTPLWRALEKTRVCPVPGERHPRETKYRILTHSPAVIQLATQVHSHRGLVRQRPSPRSPLHRTNPPFSPSSRGTTRASKGRALPHNQSWRLSRAAYLQNQSAIHKKRTARCQQTPPPREFKRFFAPLKASQEIPYSWRG